MSPSGPLATSHWIPAVAPGRSGCAAASPRARSSQSCDRYFVIAPTPPEPVLRPLTAGADAQAGEQVVLGQVGVDEAPSEGELLPRKDLAHDVIGQSHPEPRRVDLGPVGEERLAPVAQEVAHVDERGEARIERLVEAALLEPGRVRALLATREE